MTRLQTLPQIEQARNTRAVQATGCLIRRTDGELRQMIAALEKSHEPGYRVPGYLTERYWNTWRSDDPGPAPAAIEVRELEANAGARRVVVASKTR
jgi:hypothetical protein